MHRLTVCAAGALLALLLGASGCGRDESKPPAAAGAPEEIDGPRLAMPEEFARLWQARTGDLDTMLEARVVRLLVSYTATSYFVDQGRQGGTTYEAGRLLEQELNRRFKTGPLPVHVVFMPVARDRLLPELVAGHGDIAAANLTITEARLEQVAFSEPIAEGISEVIVTGPQAPALDRLEDLSGREIHVRASSSFAESLAGLNRDLEVRGLAPVRIVAVDERLETEDLLEMVHAGVYPMTVADDYLADFWAQALEGIRVRHDLPIQSGTRIGWALRQGNPGLKRFLDAFVRRNRAGTLTGNVILNRYLKSAEWVKNPTDGKQLERFRSMARLFREYGRRHDLDWLLLMAQAYQESGLDQSRRSRAGAIGVMQILPSTARDPNVDVRDIQRLENNIHAGAKYLRFVLDRYFREGPSDPVEQHLFAFAAYNAGPARVAGLRAKAARLGLDPDRWFDHVEVVAAREIGRETVQYVSNIFKYYLAYRLVALRDEEKARARKATGTR